MDHIKWLILQRCSKDRRVDQLWKESGIGKEKLKIGVITKS